MEEEPQTNELAQVWGVVLITMKIEDFSRVRDAVGERGRMFIRRYLGPISEMQYSSWSRGLEYGFVYLELPQGEWEDVLDWCASAFKVKLIEGYRYCAVGQMHDERNGIV